MGFDVWLENRTPFAAATHVQLDADGQEILLLMLSASFEQSGSGLTIAQDQMPVFFEDVPNGDPALSSNRSEADIVPKKPGVDVLLIGHAHAPGGVPAERVQVGLSAGPLRKTLEVTGDRLNYAGGVSRPAAFTTMPLVWERAFGGTTQDGQVDPRNPVGIGWKNARSADPRATSDVPNIRYPGDDLSEPEPAGFGVVGRGWKPRLALAGTYDDAWLADQWPLAPLDFDSRYNLCAPPDQQLKALPDHSEITLINLTPEGRWSFRLPGLRTPIRLIYSNRVETVIPVPDTVILEPDLKRVTLKARHPLCLVRNAPRLIGIALGHVSPVWINAQIKGKRYLNPRGGDGTLNDIPVWEP